MAGGGERDFAIPFEASPRWGTGLARRSSVRRQHAVSPFRRTSRSPLVPCGARKSRRCWRRGSP